MINKMGLEKNPGQMELSIKENIKMARNMAEDFSFGEMTATIKAIFMKIISMVRENIAGKTVESMKVNG